MMARSALGAILAGLGGGLTGYAQEQQRKRDELDRNRQRTLQEALNAASLMNEGWESPEEFARRQERVGRPAVRDVAALSRFALNPLAQPAPAVAPEGVAGIAEAQRITGGPAGRVQIGERELVLPMSKSDQSMITRALAGAERRMEGQMERQARAAERRADVEARRQADEATRAFQAEQNRLLRESNERIRGVTGETQTDTQWRTRLPAASRKRLEDSETSLAQIQALRSAVEANPDAVGLKNYVPGAFVDRLDPQGAAVRAQIELIAGEIRNARFGGQLTAQEAQLAMRALPDATQRKDILLSRLGSLEDFLNARRTGVYRSFGGGNPPPLTFEEETANAGASAADRLRAGRY